MSQVDLFTGVQDVLQKVYKTFDKNENEVKRDVEILKTWVDTQKHLPEKMGESHIKNFLILNKFSIENAKRKIDMYYTIRTLLPDFYDTCNPKSMQMANVLDHAYVCIHPKMVQDLYRMYIVKLKDPNSLMLRETILTVCNIAEIRLHEDVFFYDQHIIDMENFTFNDITKVTPGMLMRILTIYEKVFSFRFNAIYIINAPSYISKVMTILKTLMKPKMFERIHVYEDDEILKNIFTIDTLPKDYGGYGPSLQELTDIVRKKFDEYQIRFDELDKMRVKENLRPDVLTNDEMLGFYGNFKKLSVD